MIFFFFLEVRKQAGSNGQINQNTRNEVPHTTDELETILLSSFLERSKFTVGRYKDGVTWANGRNFEEQLISLFPSQMKTTDYSISCPLRLVFRIGEKSRKECKLTFRLQNKEFTSMYSRPRESRTLWWTELRVSLAAKNRVFFTSSQSPARL